MAVRRFIMLALALLLAAVPALAQQELGGLRVATSSGFFLKIGVSPRGEALAGAWAAMADDATAPWYNPAGLGLLANRQSSLGYVAWPADIHYVHASMGLPGGWLNGTWGLQLGNLSTIIAETDEYHPYGTGREFLYSDTVIGLSFARFMTDKLLMGVSAKYLREDLGSGLGLPVIQTWVVDAGTLYHIDWRDLRIGMAIQNFGPELKPSGEYWNYSEEKWEEYEGFPPPSSFRLGVAYEAYKNWPLLLTHSIEMSHPADNRETLATGLELSYGGGLLDLRCGYRWMADEMNLSAGFGTNFMLGSALAGLDYAFTDGHDLGFVHRWGMRVDF